MTDFVINITPIITIVLEVMVGSVLTVLLAKLASNVKKNVPYDTMLLVQDFARIAVKAAEQIYKSGKGEEKLNYALNFVQTQLLNHGIELDVDTIRTYIEREVLELNQMFWDMALREEEVWNTFPYPVEDEVE